VLGSQAAGALSTVHSSSGIKTYFCSALCHQLCLVALIHLLLANEVELHEYRLLNRSKQCQLHVANAILGVFDRPRTIRQWWVFAQKYHHIPVIGTPFNARDEFRPERQILTKEAEGELQSRLQYVIKPISGCSMVSWFGISSSNDTSR
jgi:hypothetical protein